MIESPRLGAGVFISVVFVLFVLIFTTVAANLNSGDIYQIDRRIEALKEIDAKIAANLERLAAHFKLIEEANKTIADELAATRTRVDIAHERIEYYRQALIVVAKTCPGRMNLPRLNGDPAYRRNGTPEEQ